VKGKTLVQSLIRSGKRKWTAVAMVLVAAGAVSAGVIVIPNLFPFLDATGLVSTFNATGAIHEDGAFFQSLGTNGRTCGTCHQASDAMGLRADNVRIRYITSRGTDPLFAAIDGANCPSGSPRNPADHSLLLGHGLIRIPITLPSIPQFTIKAVHDPYGCAIVTDDTGAQTVSVYRRPLPTTNLKFLSTIMFDGRETIQSLATPATFMTSLNFDLQHQAMDATLIHAQAANPPTAAQQADIVNFELGLNSAQIADGHAGALNQDGALGGALNLSQQVPFYYPGTNDSLGHDPEGGTFNPAAVFTMFQAWENLPSSWNPLQNYLKAQRAQIAAGEKLFNTRALTISSVRGLNDNAALGVVPVAPFMGTCTTCHDAPNAGDHSLPLPLDIGTVHSPADETDPLIANGLSQLDVPDLPVYAITGCPDPFATSTGSAGASGTPAPPYVIYTTDPGKGLVTGMCSDVDRVKGPVLRGLAARAPYFHNGAAQNLDQLLNFYNQRFQMNLTTEEKSQLEAFLNSL
jgi:cytochrome c peroxidase